MEQAPLYLDKRIGSDEALDRFLAYCREKRLELYPAQEEAILELFADKNVILNTPTGSGKSLVAAAFHFRSLALGRRSVYTSPIKALVNEKFLSLCREFGADRVGMMTGDAAVNRDAPILCCTAEILANMGLRQGKQALVKDIIIDEFHFYSDRERGAAWQIPLLTLPQCRFLLMSATFGDTTPFRDSLNSLTGQETAVVQSSDRPVPLSFRYCETPLDETIRDLLQEQLAPIYVVSFTQRECAEYAQDLLSTNFCTKAEKEAIARELVPVRFLSPYGKEFKKFLRHGIGLHHAGLLPKYRILVESLAQKGLLKIICGTDTLGVGVNVPIRTVLFTKLCKYDGEKTGILSVRDFHQIAGRAGRKGFDTKGSVVAQAPEYVIENLKLAQKALANPKKKFVRAKPPEKGFVPWNKETFDKLVSAPPEKLTSQFKVSHGMLLNVLARTGTNGCHAMKDIVRNSHESPIMKTRHRKRAFQLFRALVDRKIVEIIPKEDRRYTSVRVNLDLQDDFSLNQTLSLFFLDTIKYFDPFEDDYALKILSLAESIVENPTVILNRQVDKLKQAKLGELKAAGVEYDERMTALETIEYPKPMREFIYDAFNTFADKHPWIEQENIRPKSIAREIFETYQSFGEYIRSYDLQRAEGLLLRYISDIYNVLTQTVPFALRNDALDEIIAYFETAIKTTDSSLLDEWKKLSLGGTAPTVLSDMAPDRPAEDPQESLKRFEIRLRNYIFEIIRSLAQADYERVIGLLSPEASTQWTEDSLKARMDPYFKEHSQIRTDNAARSTRSIRIDGEIIECTLLDPEEHNDWVLRFKVDKARSLAEGRLVIELTEILS